MSRLLRRAKKVLLTEEIDRLPKEIFRTRNRSVRRVAQQLHRIARRKGEKAQKELRACADRRVTNVSMGDGEPI